MHGKMRKESSHFIIIIKITAKKMQNKSCFSFEIETCLKTSIIRYLSGPRIGILIGKPCSKLNILRTLWKIF